MFFISVFSTLSSIAMVCGALSTERLTIQDLLYRKGGSKGARVPSAQGGSAVAAGSGGKVPGLIIEVFPPSGLAACTKIDADKMIKKLKPNEKTNCTKVAHTPDLEACEMVEDFVSRMLGKTNMSVDVVKGMCAAVTIERCQFVACDLSGNKNIRKKDKIGEPFESLEVNVTEQEIKTLMSCVRSKKSGTLYRPDDKIWLQVNGPRKRKCQV
ncbi:hypothetical protein AAL_03380 [Moelleriella libera RCEF 2490]|uniref:Uncharacterized protein n=1 Tax=Moelleriella libera RCEF 2490 TaxID=1081109 RepID=A0A168D6N2_9HYPO|nr:hypothetical protein AAL_03380 [Moelleriella libera RCEF 2490]